MEENEFKSILDHALIDENTQLRARVRIQGMKIATLEERIKVCSAPRTASDEWLAYQRDRASHMHLIKCLEVSRDRLSRELHLLADGLTIDEPVFDIVDKLQRRMKEIASDVK